MSTLNSTIPILDPPSCRNIYVDTVTSGPNISPIERVSLYSSKDWEVFVEEWLSVKKDEYQKVERCGGSGDMGRDVIAWSDQTNLMVWDNYQCKHYDHALHPSDIWIELGKLMYYTYIEEFNLPRFYYFIAPRGVGTSLSSLLGNPDKLRLNLFENWSKRCENYITKTQSILLVPKFKNYIEQVDFSIFKYISPMKIIEDHKQTPFYVARFGGGLPERPRPSSPPVAPADNEIQYLTKLLEAYGDHLGRKIRNINDIREYKELKDHLFRSRIEFYSAEALRRFSRDTLSEEIFMELQEEIFCGIIDIIHSEFSDGYIRVKEVVKTSQSLNLTSNALINRTKIPDKRGICHQLANEREEVTWIRE
ncbi:ABC-three component system protein [uncultured Sphaerochaeta sp.]|uniref:ABC-three component system protein n=1 Tax=uncultured Sphaerochaeta sp. TaxID=886478 RepID=UPI002AA90881|nr:ABC-three component system protein [uncultured Sphaerochaeta sp.]